MSENNHDDYLILDDDASVNDEPLDFTSDSNVITVPFDVYQPIIYNTVCTNGEHINIIISNDDLNSLNTKLLVEYKDYEFQCLHEFKFLNNSPTDIYEFLCVSKPIVVISSKNIKLKFNKSFYTSKLEITLIKIDSALLYKKVDDNDNKLNDIMEYHSTIEEKLQTLEQELILYKSINRHPNYKLAYEIGTYKNSATITPYAVFAVEKPIRGDLQYR
jgi:hypothetical protein